MKRTNTNGTVRRAMAGLVGGAMVLALASGCSRLATDSGTSKIIGKNGDPCPAIAAPSQDFCPDGRAEQVNNANGCPNFVCVPLDCPVEMLPEKSSFCPDGTIEKLLDDKGCPTFKCAPLNCPIYNQPECPAGEHVEVKVGEDGCSYPACVAFECPEVMLPEKSSFCPDGKIVQVKDDKGCASFECQPLNCPIYNRPLCQDGEQLQILVDEDGCNYPECVPVVCPPIMAPEKSTFCPDGTIVTVKNANGCPEFKCVPPPTPDPCPMIAAPDATFCPGGQVLLDEAACNWVCHGGDKCPYLGEFQKCLGTTVILSDPSTHCLTGIDCLP